MRLSTLVSGLVLAVAAIAGASSLDGAYASASGRLWINGEKIRMTSTTSGRTIARVGVLRDGVATFGSMRYRVEAEQDGVRVTEQGNRSNSVWYRRVTSGLIASDRVQSPPKWLVGWFGGHMADGTRVTLNVRRDGSVVAHFSPDTVVDNRETGTYRSGKIFFGNTAWQVSRAGKGVRIVQMNRRANAVTLNPISPEDSSIGRRPPSWMVGTFVGTHWNGSLMTLTVEREGRVWVMYGRDGRREADRVSGAYQNGKIRIGNAWFTVAQLDDGVRLRQEGTSNRVDLRRS